ncbi:MAG: zinc dependent phospholipase C family protein [Gemmatimonadota bacterium]|nr:zinc dependent phospholipase C family protein [Gemmatimonadota bacterium]
MLRFPRAGGWTGLLIAMFGGVLAFPPKSAAASPHDRDGLARRVANRHAPRRGRTSDAAAQRAVDPGRAAAERFWHVKTHVFAANVALADAIDNGKVTIPPFGEFTVNAELVQALKQHPSDYRSGVVGPDVFPDIYVGQSFAHVDHWKDGNHWIADHWLRQVFGAARASTDPEDLRQRRLAFGYGWLTHAAQDMFGHTFINHYVGAKWASSFATESLKVDAMHVTLEAYVAKHTPSTDSTIDVDDRFQAEHLIKPRAIKDHVQAPHYQRFLAMHGWLGTSIDQTFQRLGGDTSWTNCYLSSTEKFWDCENLFFMIGWRKDIDRGLRHLVDANHTLGESILAGRVDRGIGALMDWKSEWVPKMFGLHLVGEFDKEMSDFMDWWKKHNPLAPLDSVVNKAILDEVQSFVQHNLGPEYEYFKLIISPANDVRFLFPAESLAKIRADMHLRAGPDSLLDWREFEALYNTIIASKLVLLDGDQLNELARRAGMPGPLYAPGPESNVMLGVPRSLDGDHQWDSASAPGLPAYGLPFRRPAASKPGAVAGPGSIARLDPLLGRRGAVDYSTTPPERADTATGFAFFQAPGAKEKIFQRIFKGWGGPGPGPSLILDPAVTAVSLVARKPSLSELATDIDSIRIAATALEQRLRSFEQLRSTQVALLLRQSGNTRYSWGRACCGAIIHQLRSSLGELESDLGNAERQLRARSDPRAATVLEQMGKDAAAIDVAAESLLTATEQIAAQRASAQIATGIAALARARDQAARAISP